VARQVLFGLFLIPPMVVVQPATAEVTGYLKTLWFDTKTLVEPDEDVSLGVNRARLTWRESIREASLLVSYDLEWQFGSYLASSQYDLQRLLQPDPYWDIQGQWQRSRHQLVKNGVYRAYLTIPVGPVDMRMGRQQLNWSRTFLWSSFDRFNPYNPLQLEPEERQGVDAVQFIWNFNGHSAEVVGVGKDDDVSGNKNAWGLRYRGNFKSTDLDVMLADFGSTRSVGVAAAGQLGSAGFRVELTQNWSDKLKLGTSSRNYQDLVFSVDYTFANNTTIIGEALYRGDGSSSPEFYDYQDYLSASRTDLAKRYLGVVVRRGFEPIARLDASILYNVEDESLALIPSLIYSPGEYEDLQLRAGVQIFNGQRNSEFGSLENLAFIELQWFY